MLLSPFQSHQKMKVERFAITFQLAVMFLSLSFVISFTNAQDQEEDPSLDNLGAKLREIYKVVRNNRMQELSNYFQLHGRPRFGKRIFVVPKTYPSDEDAREQIYRGV
ncbi:hypothetical protein FGIG_08911 [Fasciola gigantica]|uniref:Uncharacterized protein n=1 Tax=Fasciola gigantica TaxID=46835 RepID=A0A504YKJ7_FASGI|nr:hypothetical protein FGIG_08911 [Fasciola gigantica]